MQNQLGNGRRVLREIEPLNESDLTTDLKFLYHNRADHVDLFVEEALPMIKYHINEVMVKYQEKLLANLTNYMKGEVAGVILRTRQETIYEDVKKERAATVPPVEDGTYAW